MSAARVDPAPGLKNWKSNAAKAVRISRADGPPESSVHNREHFDGQVDARVGGTYADPETEDRYRQGLIVAGTSKGRPVTMAAMEHALARAKTEWRADPANPAKKKAYKTLAAQVAAARRPYRMADPRRRGIGV